MRKSEVKKGGIYLAKVSSKLTKVRIDVIREDYKGDTVYDVTNLPTGRKTTFRSAAKFRKEIGELKKPQQQIIDLDEQSSDPTQGSSEFSQSLDAPNVNQQTIDLGAASDVVNTGPSIGNFLAAIPTQGGSIPEVVAGYTPTEEQRAILEAAIEPGLKTLVILAGAGAGKCLGKGTPVLLYNGTVKSVEDVVTGDILMGPDSLQRKVLSTTKGQGTLFQVNPVKGEPFICNDAHILVLQGTNRLKGQVLEVPTINYVVQAKKSPLVKRNWKLWRVGVEFPSQMKLAISPYLLGLWLGDGTRGTMDIYNSKPEVHQYCREFAESLGMGCSITEVVQPKGNTFCIKFLHTDRRLFSNPLRLLFCLECKIGKLKTIPQRYLTASREERLQLLAGVIDTDGMFNETSGTEVTVTGKYYRDGLLYLVRSLGLAAYCGEARFHQCKNGKISEYYRIWISGDLSIIPTLVRKFPPRQQVKRVGVTGFSIDYIGEGDYFGFTLDGDGRFLLGDFTVTHNTSTLKMLEEVLPGIGQYTAFNRPLVNESKTKFRKAKCSTTHGICFAQIGRKFVHRFKPIRMRSEELARRLGIEAILIDVPDQPEPKRLSPAFLAGQCIVACKKFCQSADRGITTRHFRYIDGIDLPFDGKRTCENNERVREYLLLFAEKVWQDWCNPQGTLPYQQDAYVKMFQLGMEGKPFIASNYILLDEHQDTAPVFVNILKQQTHALLILVGDNEQRIYEWRGAINAGDEFPDAPQRALSQSFRFGQTIADVANSILSHLSYTPSIIMKGCGSIPSRVDKVENPDCYLCRTNAGAVSYFLLKLKEGKKPHLVGDVSQIVSFTEAARELQEKKSTSHPELCCFSSWAEVQQYSKEDEGEDLRLMVKLVDEFKCDAILDGLRHMVPMDQADVTVSTAHKSKGKEWGTVKLASDFFPLNKMDDSACRLLYVAATRAKHILDTTDCPPFGRYTDKVTGEITEGIKLRYTIEMPTEKELQTYLSIKKEEKPTPTTPQENSSFLPSSDPSYSPSLRDVTFTWGKQDGIWFIRGPEGFENKTVTVTKRSGQMSQERLGKVKHKFGDVWLYELKK